MSKTQLKLFDTPKTELDAVWESVLELKDSQAKARKRLFFEIGELRKELLAVRAENERLKFSTESKPLLTWVV